MGMRRLLTVVVLALAAALPASAFGAWSAPATISSPHTFASGLHAFTMSGGSTVAAWTFQDGIGAHATGGASFVVRPAGGAFGAEHALPSGFLDLGHYGRTRLLALAESRDRVQVAFGSIAGMGAPRTLFHGDVRYQPQLAVDGSGDAIVGWIQGASHNRRIVRVATRAAGGAFSAPITLAGSGRADALAVGIGPRGAVAAFERSGRLLARVRRAAGPHATRAPRWLAAQDVGPAALGTENDIRSRETSTGRVVIVWRHRQLTEGGDDGPSVLDATYLAVGATRFVATERLEASGAGAPTLEETGSLVGYAEQTPSGTVARLRNLDPRPGPAIDVGQGGGLTDVVPGIDASGTLATWMAPQPGGDGAGQGFIGYDHRPPQAAITPSEAVQELLTVDRGGGLAAVWIARPGGTGPGIPIARLKTVVRTADEVSPPPAP
jgi:hypothetical protein